MKGITENDLSRGYAPIDSRGYHLPTAFRALPMQDRIRALLHNFTEGCIDARSQTGAWDALPLAVKTQLSVAFVEAQKAAAMLKDGAK